MQPEDLHLLYIRSDDGANLIPLDAVATWEASLGPQAVNHLNQFTSVTISFNLIPARRFKSATAMAKKLPQQFSESVCASAAD